MPPGDPMDKSVIIIVQTRCPTPNCKGRTFSLNDGAARMAGYMGREHYKCDICHSRWSIPVPQINGWQDTRGSLTRGQTRKVSRPR
jgi:hypothetical protein